MDEEKKEVVEVEKIENTEDVKQEETQNDVEESKKSKKGYCIASLVLGIVALVFFCLWYVSIPCGILAIIFGILGIKTVNKGMAIAGLITGSIGLVISILILVFLLVMGFAIGFSGALDDNSINDIKHNIIDYNYDMYD